MKGIRGRDIVIESQVFLDRNIPLLADLTGATLKALVKESHRDTDAQALFVLTPITIGAGWMKTVISSTQSNAITQDRVYLETMAILADGTVIGSGIDCLEIEGNVIKDLSSGIGTMMIGSTFIIT